MPRNAKCGSDRAKNIFRVGRILAVSQISKASQRIPGSLTSMDRGAFPNRIGPEENRVLVNRRSRPAIGKSEVRNRRRYPSGRLPRLADAEASDSGRTAWLRKDRSGPGDCVGWEYRH